MFNILYDVQYSEVYVFIKMIAGSIIVRHILQINWRSLTAYYIAVVYSPLCNQYIPSTIIVRPFLQIEHIPVPQLKQL